MELYQLRAFIAVAEHGQLHRASEQLHLTASALSKQVKGLEAELGVTLFERTRDGMLLTGAGRRLLPMATQVTGAATQLAALATSIHGRLAGALRLGTIVDPDAIRLGPLMAQLLQCHPHVDVSLVQGVSGALLKQLREGDLDACFHLGLPKDAQIAVRPLRLEHYVVVAPAAWAPRLQSATWEDLAQMPWLATAPGSSLRELVGQIFAQRGLAYRVVVQADHEASMLGLMRAGLGLALVRERIALPLAQRGDGVVWAGARLPCPLSLLYRRSDADRDVLQALLAAVSAVWQGEPAAD
jgi:DNA-binding transcriptional LysR family regulator